MLHIAPLVFVSPGQSSVANLNRNGISGYDSNLNYKFLTRNRHPCACPFQLQSSENYISYQKNTFNPQNPHILYLYLITRLLPRDNTLLYISPFKF